MRLRAMFAILWLLLAAPALAGPAELQVLPTVVRQQGQSVNIRSQIVNVGRTAVHAPYEIHLLVRGSAQEDWRLIKVWHEHGAPAGQKVARDYLPVGDLDPALRSGVYQVRTEVWADGRMVSSNDRMETPQHQ